MTTRRPIYRLTVYAPRSEDATETTVMTPISGGLHSDPFVLTSIQGVTGAKPYLGLPTGRQGGLDAQTRKLTIGNLTLPVFDNRITAGETNAQRWVTAFLGDALGRPRLKGCKFTLERALDGLSASFAPYFAGRIRNYSLAGPLQFTLDLTDFSDDLKRRVFLGIPDASVSYASSATIIPLGTPVPFGNARPQLALTGSFSVDGQGYGRVLFETGPGHAPPFITKAANDLESTVVPRVVKLKNVAAGTTGYFLWLASAPLNTTTYGGSTPGARHLRYGYVSLGLLPATDPRYTAFYANGTAIEFLAFLDAPPTPTLPVIVGDVHPVQHFADLLDGKFSRASGDTTLRPLAARDSAVWAPFLADASWGTIRNLVTAPAKANEYIERVICQSKNLGYRFDAAGKIVPVDLRRADGLSATGATLTDDDLVTDIEPAWSDARDGAITGVTFTYYVDRVLDPAEIDADTDLYPDIPTTGLASVAVPTYTPNDLSTLRDVGEKNITIDATGVRVMAGEVDASGRDRTAATLAMIEQDVKAFLRPFATGTVKASATYRQGSNAAGLVPGAVRLVNHSKLVNTATSTRGGARLMLCLSAADVDDRIAVEWLDCGGNTVAAVPAITSVVAVAPNSATVTVTANAAGDDVEVWSALTASTVSVAPAATSAAWVRAGSRSGSGVVTIAALPAGMRVWTRARSIPKGGALAQPSPYAFPGAPGYLALSTMTAPSGVVVTSPTAQSAHVTWTNGDAAMRVELLLVAGTAPAAWTEDLIVESLAAGSVAGDIAVTAAGATYTVGVRHRDPSTGAVSAVAAVTFTAGSVPAVLTAPQAPTGYSAGATRAQSPSSSGGGQVKAPVARAITYGLAVVATVGPAQVEFREAVETGVGTGVYGTATTVALLDAVINDWTVCALQAPNDGKRRRLSARTVLGSAESAWTADVELLPSTALALRPLSGGPSLDVVATPGATSYSVACTAPGGTVELSISGGAYATAPASPVTVTRPAIGASPLEYSFRVVAAGQTVVDTVTIQPIDKDTITPDLTVVPGTPTATQIPYTISATNPATGATLNGITVEYIGTTADAGVTPAGVYPGQTSGTVLHLDRPPFSTTTVATIRVTVTLSGGGSETIQRTIPNQVRSSFGPSLVVTPTPGSGSYALAYSGTYDTLVLSIDGGTYSAPAASPITVTRDANDHTYAFKATKDAQDTPVAVTIPALVVGVPAFSSASVGIYSYPSDQVQCAWAATNAPGGATYDIDIWEQNHPTDATKGASTTYVGVSSPYIYTSPINDLDTAGTRTKAYRLYVSMKSGVTVVANAVSATTTLPSNT